jgi:CO/xanthine dehydrogenase FAD-binding subunit
MSEVAFLQPTSWAEALEARRAEPEAIAVAGGTDVMVEVNFDRSHPEALLDLGRVQELKRSTREDGMLRIGAGVTYTHLVRDLHEYLPALAQAARTVGSPPIRNRGTVGGNLGSASPAGDCHPPLLASGAEIEVASSSRSRTVPAEEFFVGPKRSVLEEDELVAAVWVPVAKGPQVFQKVGVRNAMIIAACSFALALDPEAGKVGTGIGSAGPVPLRAKAAEEFLEQELESQGAWEHKGPIDDAVVARFSELVAASARPIDDVRATAAYRRHALAVLSSRALRWCWASYLESRS